MICSIIQSQCNTLGGSSVYRSNGVHKCSPIQLLLLLIFSPKYSMTLTPRYPLSSAAILKTTTGLLLLLLNLNRLAPCYMKFNNHQASKYMMVNVSLCPLINFGCLYKLHNKFTSQLISLSVLCVMNLASSGGWANLLVVIIILV